MEGKKLEHLDSILCQFMAFHAMTERKNSRFNLRSNQTEIALDICGHMI